MLFNSLLFIFLFFPTVLSIALCLRGNSLLCWITFSSFLFYALFGQPWFLIPMVITTTLDFFIAWGMERAPTLGKRFTLLIISLGGNLGLLIYFKYGMLLMEMARAIEGNAGLSSKTILLPAGISFYTFQTLSYVLDVYRRKAPVERNFVKFAAFVSFFPHLIAGPLTRHDQLLPALDRMQQNGIHSRWAEGLFLFSVGLCKKALIADPIARLIDPWIDAPHAMGFGAAWIALIGYALQIYFDFSGYCDMAIGLGRLLGVELPQNFNAPYQATSPTDFWRRWHITLSTWLRDYLYIPLGGGHGPAVQQISAVLITFFLGGLWHGARWTFAAWGVYQALLLLIFRYLKHSWERWPVAAQRGVTFFLITLGWVFFRANSFSHANAWFRSLIDWQSERSPTLATYSLGLVGVAWLATQLGTPLSKPGRLENLSSVRQITLGIVTAFAVLWMNQSSRFLYFQF